jgi:transcriptional regulator of acetoin/glycerol metabolism
VALADLPAELSRTPRAFTGLEQAERAAITAALRASGGNRSHAAEALGIGRATLYRKLRHYGLAD